MNTTSEIRFCVRYLLDKGINALNFNEVIAALPPVELDDKFELLKIPKKTNFFDDLATKLRELWPPGEKDGKYPWRDSVSNLSKRLRMLWKERFPDFVEKEDSVEQCLTVARRYLAQFEHDTKYMQTLKYFILKQKQLVEKDGRIKYISDSKFADMLEGKNALDAIENEWNFLVNDINLGEGELR